MSPSSLRRFAFALMVMTAPVSAAEPPAVAPPALTPGQALEDIQLSIDIVEAALPDLYWHQSREAWAAARAEALARASQITDPMQVYTEVATLMGPIGEGHFDVLPSQGAVAWERQTASVLPLDLHWNTDGVFVRAGYGGAADIPVGSRVLSINGDGDDTMLAELLRLSSHDGQITTLPMRDIGARYAIYRHRLHGNEASFALRYTTPQGATVARTVTATPLADRPREPVAEKAVARLEWLAPGVAYLDVSTFSNRVYREAHTDFRSHIRRLFEEIERGRATRLILDLRRNGGGSEPNESILFSFLVAQPLHKYASVQTRGQHLRVTSRSGRVFEQDVFDEDEIHFQKVLPDGRLSRLNVPPEGLMSHWVPSVPVYRGRLVVLAGGATFSGGAELASMLHHVRRGVFVGEEVGGTHEGNTSGYNWRVELPNSGVRLKVPLLKFTFNWPGLPQGRGVPAQCDVPPSVMEIGVVRDRAWRVARAVAEQSWRDPRQAQCPTVE